MTTSVITIAADEFDATAADWIAVRLRSAIERRGEGSLGLSGGATPEPVLIRLASWPLDWSRVSVYFGDERAVPPDDPASNFAMARRSLLDHVPVPAGRVHRMMA